MHNNAFTNWRIECKQYHILSIHNKYAIMIVLKVHLHSYMLFIQASQRLQLHVVLNSQLLSLLPSSHQLPSVNNMTLQPVMVSDCLYTFRIKILAIYVSSSCDLQAIQSKMLSYYINMSFQESVLNGKLLLPTWSIVLPQRRQSIRQTGDYPGIAVQIY